MESFQMLLLTFVGLFIFVAGVPVQGLGEGLDSYGEVVSSFTQNASVSSCDSESEPTRVMLPIPTAVGPVLLFSSKSTPGCDEEEKTTSTTPATISTLGQFSRFLITTLAYEIHSAVPRSGPQTVTFQPKCTTTTIIDNAFTFGPTSTVFAAVETSTSLIPCGGCVLTEILRNGIGPGIQFNTTVTVAAISTVTTIMCSPGSS